MNTELLLTGSLDLSFFLILIGGIFLYFGKLIGDTKVQKYDKLSLYIEGLFFSGLFVYLPMILVYFVLEKLLIAAPSWLITLQMLIVGCLSWNIIAHGLLRRHGLLEVYRRKLRKEFNELKATNKSLKGWAINKEEWFKSRYGMDFVELCVLAFYSIPIKILGNYFPMLTFSFLTIWITASLYHVHFYFYFSILFSFFIFSMMALSYGFGTADYPSVKIHLGDGREIEGRILKFGEFIYILNGDKKIFVNRDSVEFIEESLFKNRKA